MAKTTVIKATSRASIKISDSFYTIEYGEERTVAPDEDLDEARAGLWETCNGETDRQIEEILDMFKNKK